MKLLSQEAYNKLVSASNNWLAVVAAVQDAGSDLGENPSPESLMSAMTEGSDSTDNS